LPHSGHTYELGVSSYTGRRDTYRVSIRVDGHLVDGWSSIALSSGHGWTTVVHLPAHTSVHATLFRGGTPGPYRQVFIRDASG
jgi:hypothetical protein